MSRGAHERMYYSAENHRPSFGEREDKELYSILFKVTPASLPAVFVIKGERK